MPFFQKHDPDTFAVQETGIAKQLRTKFNKPQISTVKFYPEGTWSAAIVFPGGQMWELHQLDVGEDGLPFLTPAIVDSIQSQLRPPSKEYQAALFAEMDAKEQALWESVCETQNKMRREMKDMIGVKADGNNFFKGVNDTQKIYG